MSSLTVGVDVGGTHVRAGVVVDGRVVEVMRRAHDVPGTTALSYESLVLAIGSMVAELRHHEGVSAVGVSMAGTLSANRSTVVSNAHRDWEGRGLPADLHDVTGLPVRMENDGNCAAWAEHVSGSGQGVDPFVMLTLGTGVGGGVVANGSLVIGRHGIAGELGHICVVEPHGAPCDCGAFGCLEQYASGRALIGRFHAGPDEDWRGTTSWPFAGRPDDLRATEALFARGLAESDRWVLEVVHDAGRAVGAGVAALTRVLDIGRVAVGGGAATLGPPLFDAIRAGVKAYPGLPSRRLDVEIVPAHHGELAGLVGAALLAEPLSGAGPASIRRPAAGVGLT